jgi:hypothetical protein
MSFEQEWAQHKATADQQNTHMQLNQLPASPGGDGGSGGPGGDLATSPAQKKKAANYIEKHLAPDTNAAGRLADEESSAVAGGGSASGGPVMGTFLPQQKWRPPMTSPGGGGEFRDWDTKSGLSTAMSAWERQVKGLEARLSSYMSALRGANNLYQGQDGLTGSQLGKDGPSLYPPNSPPYINPSPRSGISDY